MYLATIGNVLLSSLFKKFLLSCMSLSNQDYNYRPNALLVLIVSSKFLMPTLSGSLFGIFFFGR